MPTPFANSNVGHAPAKPAYGAPLSPLGLGALGVWSAHAGYSATVPCAGWRGAQAADGTLTGAGATRVSGAWGRCLHFDGSTGYLTASPTSGSVVDGTWNPLAGTVVVWFRSAAAAANTWITGRISAVGGANSGIYLFLASAAPAGIIYFVVANVGQGSQEALVASLNSGYDDGNWHMAAAVFRAGNSTVQSLYVDGVFQGSATTGSGNWTFGSNVIRWGISSDTFWGKFTGDMEPGAWFPRALTAAEIASLWRDGPGAFYRRPVPVSVLSASMPAAGGGLFLPATLSTGAGGPFFQAPANG